MIDRATLLGLGIAAAAAGAAWAFSGCGASSSEASGASDKAGPTGGGGPPGSAGAGGASAPADGGAPAPPPEKEVEGSYESPVATGKYVWAANPKSGRVAYVDAASLDVKTVEAGNGPTYLAAVPSKSDDAAIVLNVLSYDATLLRAGPGTLAARTFKVAKGMNAWSLSAGGRWAVAWTDAKRVPKADKTEGFQDVSVLDLDGKASAATVLAVGYRPVSVAFASDGQRAFAVTQDGVSVIDLLAPSGPTVASNVPISDKPLEDPGTRDVAVTPDGKWALVRRDGEKDITVVSLASGVRTTVPLDGKVTDLDLADTGTRAVAVMREIAMVAVLPIPEIAAQPSAYEQIEIKGETVGSTTLAPGGKTALLYTNAVPVERLTILAIEPSLSYRTVKLYAPVLAAFPTADAAHALVVHDKPQSPQSNVAGAFSLVPIASALPAKIVGTEAPIHAVALSPASDRAVVTLRDDATKKYGVHVARFPSLAVDAYALASPPIAAGVVAGAGKAFVAQQHPEGRMTFIDLASGQARTITGYELGSKIVDGSQP